MAFGLALGDGFGGVRGVRGCEPVAVASAVHLPVVVVDEVVTAPAHEHEVVETGLAATLTRLDVVGFAVAGRLAAADARAVASDQRASLCCAGRSAGDGLIQRR